jgi:hypothetical protein
VETSGQTDRCAHAGGATSLWSERVGKMRLAIEWTQLCLGDWWPFGDGLKRT